MSASLVSRKAFDAVGGFDESLTNYEEEDLFLRMFCMWYDIIFVDRPLSQWSTCNGTLFHFPRKAGSDIIYFKKLLRDFPDDPKLGRFFARDFVVPRFFARLAIDYASALRSGRFEDAIAVLPDLSFVVHQHRLRIRLFMKLVLPILHFPHAARCLLIPLLPSLRPIKQRALRIGARHKAGENRVWPAIDRLLIDECRGHCHSNRGWRLRRKRSRLAATRPPLPPSVPSRDHPPRRLAIPPVQPQPAGR
jgi:hypothetical protein